MNRKRRTKQPGRLFSFDACLIDQMRCPYSALHAGQKRSKALGSALNVLQDFHDDFDHGRYFYRFQILCEFKLYTAENLCYMCVLSSAQNHGTFVHPNGNLVFASTFVLVAENEVQCLSSSQNELSFHVLPVVST
jgi:hypothetical protein